MSAILFMACVLLSSVSSVHLDVDDSVLENGRYGTDVALLFVPNIQQAAIFVDHSKLLRRIAYVKTEDGSNVEAFNEGMNGGSYMGCERGRIHKHANRQ